MEAGSRSGANAASRRSSSAIRAAEEAPRPAQQDDPDVEALAALDARHDADDRVLERVTRRLGHVPPPRRRTAAPRAARVR